MGNFQNKMLKLTDIDGKKVFVPTKKEGGLTDINIILKETSLGLKEVQLCFTGKIKILKILT